MSDLAAKLKYADHMLVAVSNQRNSAHNDVVHLEAKLALANSRIADLEAELAGLRTKPKSNDAIHETYMNGTIEAATNG